MTTKLNFRSCIFALLTIIALCLSGSAKAQTVNVPFSTNAAGKSLPINWGMDAAWDWDYNVMRGIAHYGKNFTTGRISFQPYNLVDVSKINDASANFGLSAGQVRKLQWRIDLIKRTGATKVNINCDHEVLTKKMNNEGNYGDEIDLYGRSKYLNQPQEWVNLIKATVKYAQAQGLTVVSVSPFNESDYGWDQYEENTNSSTKKYTASTDSEQNNTGIPAFKAIAKLIKEDSFFNGIRVCGGNTLNCDRASAWYEGLKPYVDEGNTHQLAGSFDNYADFFKKVSDDGKVATADELHNVGEAMVGVEYGMQNGIWWGFDSKARGQFMHDSNEGVRLGYAEDRSHWTSAAVYRNDKDGEIHGFIGSSERQANVSTYNFQCQDREVYFNGYGPQKEWSVTTVGGAKDSYQNGQINYERLFDITYGDDVQSAPVDGNYQIMSAADMKLVTSNGYWADNNHLSAAAQTNDNSQRWHIYPGRSDGDCSYWFIDNVGDATQHWNLLNGGGAGAMEAGSRVICYNANHDALEQWYLRYAKDGYFYIMARQSNKYLYNNNGTLTLQDAPTKSTGAKELKKYMWRLMPTDAVAEQTAPATPTGLAEGTVNATSASISWTAVAEANVTYNVLRQDANGWNTIARLQSGTTYTDTKVESGKGYRYKVQAVDYSGNRSDASEVITIMVPEEQGGETPTFTAGQWKWVGEELASKEFYLLNKQNKVFLGKGSISTTPSVLWTATYNTTVNFKNGSDDIWIQVNNNNGNISSVSVNTTGTAGTNASSDLSVKGDKNGFQFYYTRSWNYTQVFWQATAYGTGFISTDGKTISSVNVSGNNPTTTNNNTYWLLVTPNQYAKYAKVSDYTTAFNTAKGYLTAELSTALKNELIETLDACDGTINYQNIEGYISRLNGIADKCRNYTPSGEGEDFTGLIINPSIIQSGTTNDAPTGWIGAKTNVTGNGHWTEGTGDTRLEAWNWSTNANGLDVDYYQDIIVPNGLYTLTAVTHQRANGDAALYAETYELREMSTTMPVGDGNEAETSVQSILVTDGTLRIGIKATNDYKDVDNQWVTADNFTLTRVSTPENTALSHYTAAISYLNGLAEVELGRNIDHTELLAAYNAANNSEANASAYETAINNLAAAIKRSQAMVAAEPVLSGSWIGQTGNYGDAAERYNWDTPYPAGRILYQVVEDLIPGAEYEIQFYAVANVARNLDADQYSGSGIAYLFANDTEEDISVIYQDGCTPTNYPCTLRAIADENGQIAYGIANRKTGGQWYVAKAKSITLLGMSHTATLSVKANKYGTFVAPFDVTLPDGVTAYTASINDNGDKVVLEKLAEEGETLSANTPVILKNNTSSNISKSWTELVNNLPPFVNEGEVLVGCLVSGINLYGNGNPKVDYALQTQNNVQAFYYVDKAFNSTQNKAYIKIPAGNNAPARLVFDMGEATEIEAVLNDYFVKKSEAVYNLNGQRVNNNAKGIVIINGKKFFNK